MLQISIFFGNFSPASLLCKWDLFFEGFDHRDEIEWKYDQNSDHFTEKIAKRVSKQIFSQKFPLFQADVGVTKNLLRVMILIKLEYCNYTHFLQHFKKLMQVSCLLFKLYE